MLSLRSVLGKTSAVSSAQTCRRRDAPRRGEPGARWTVQENLHESLRERQVRDPWGGGNQEKLRKSWHATIAKLLALFYFEVEEVHEFISQVLKMIVT